jgi:ABC-2 type transport system ATP-binding protein
LGDPRLLILDEPLSGLDPEGVEVLIELFRHLSSDLGVTIVLSSHHLREVEAVCTRVGMIEAGRTVLEGRVETLLQDAGDGVRVICAQAKGAKQAESVLAKFPGVSGVVCKEVQGQAVLRARVATGTPVAALLSQLVESGCEVEEFVRERASLVDVFQRAVRPAATQATEISA